jgi:hypothetical protein
MTARTRPQGAVDRKIALVADSSNEGADRAAGGRCIRHMVVPVRLLLIAVLALSGMAIFANSALLARARIDAGCSTVRSEGGEVLQACHAGWFKGYPNLMAKGCTAVGAAARLQYWSCPKGV